MHDDFNVKGYREFKTLFLERDELLDKMPGPVIRGELARNASKVNISNAETLNWWTRKISDELVKSTSLSNKEIEFIPIEDWKQGTAAILNIDLSRSDLLEDPKPISVLVYDSSDVRIQLSEPLARLMRFKWNKKKFTNRDAATVLLSRIVNRALS